MADWREGEKEMDERGVTDCRTPRGRRERDWAPLKHDESDTGTVNSSQSPLEIHYSSDGLINGADVGFLRTDQY